jgi:hypothetical protein
MSDPKNTGDEDSSRNHGIQVVERMEYGIN